MRKRIGKIILPLFLIGIFTLAGTERPVVEYTNAPEAEFLRPFKSRLIEAGKTYESNLNLFILSVIPGARINAEIIQLDSAGNEIVRNASDGSFQPVFADGCQRKISVFFSAQAKAEKAVLQLNYGGNPVSFRILDWDLKEVLKKNVSRGYTTSRILIPQTGRRCLMK